MTNNLIYAEKHLVRDGHERLAVLNLGLDPCADLIIVGENRKFKLGIEGTVRRAPISEGFV
jgi:hypothetical protein